MKHKRNALFISYQAALRKYLAGSKASLKPALRLGHQAVTLGLETIDMALIHEESLLAHALIMTDPIRRELLIQKARLFFAEAIIPVEQTHLAAMAANIRLALMNKGLDQRTLELATSNQQLKKEIAHRKVAEEALKISEHQTLQLLKQSKLLSRGILSVQEEERKRISRELHDVIGQTLTGINVRMATLKTEATANTKGLSKSIAQTQRLVGKSLDIVHQFASELRPAVLDDLGLIPALHSSLKTFTLKTGIRTSMTAFAGVESLSIGKRTALYRIAHEALTNVVRHARAEQVEVHIHKISNFACMDIKDNGTGFNVDQVLYRTKQKRLGFLGIRERTEMYGGKFNITSTPGQGTTLQVQLPLGNRSGMRHS